MKDPRFSLFIAIAVVSASAFQQLTSRTTQQIVENSQLNGIDSAETSQYFYIC